MAQPIPDDILAQILAQNQLQGGLLGMSSRGAPMGPQMGGGLLDPRSAGAPQSPGMGNINGSLPPMDALQIKALYQKALERNPPSMLIGGRG